MKNGYVSKLVELLTDDFYRFDCSYDEWAEVISDSQPECITKFMSGVPVDIVDEVWAEAFDQVKDNLSTSDTDD